MSDTPQREDEFTVTRGWLGRLKDAVDERGEGPDLLAARRMVEHALECCGPRIPSPEELAELCRDRDALRECLRDSIVALAEFERLALMRNRYREPLSVALHIRVMIDKILKALRKYPLDTALAASKADAEKEGA